MAIGRPQTTSRLPRVHDPCVAKEGDVYYVFSTGRGITVHTSRDRVNWQRKGRLFEWAPNLLCFNNLRSYATPNYYVQQMFMRHRGETILPVSLSSVPIDEKGGPRLYVSATLSSRTQEVILKVVNATSREIAARLTPVGRQLVGPESSVRLTTLSAGLHDTNSLDEPRRVSPTETRLRWTGSGGELTLAPRSLAVARIALKPKAM